MSGVSFGGLVSGMNTDTVIQQLMDIETRQVNLVQAKKSAIVAKQQAWGKIKASLQSLEGKLDLLRFPSIFQARATTLTDSTVANVTASADAVLTSHTLTVNTLAQTHVVAGKAQADPNAALNLANPGNLTIKTDASATPAAIAIGATDTLNSIRDKINLRTDLGVHADVVKDTTGYRLFLTSNNSGTAKQIIMSDDKAYALTNELGFMSNATTWVAGAEVSKAADATFTLDGVNYTRGSNTVSDTVPGLTLTLKKAGSTNVAVTQDADKTADAVKAWLDAVNDTLSTLSDLTKYDAGTKKGGVLNGDPLARQITNKLRDQFSQVVAGLPAAMNQPSEAGIGTGKWNTADFGKIVFDRDKFKAALLKDADGVAKMLGVMRNNVATGSTLAVSTTAAGSYAASDLINGDIDPVRFGKLGGGWQSAGTPSATNKEFVTTTFAGGPKMVDQLQLYFPDDATGNGLGKYTIYADTTGSGTFTKITDVTTGTGATQTTDFATTKAYAIKVEWSAGAGPVKLTELKVNEQNTGAISSMKAFVHGATAYQTGTLASRDDRYLSEIAVLDKKITGLNTAMTTHEQSLRMQFTRMEQAMAKFNSQSAAFAQMAARPAGY